MKKGIVIRSLNGSPSLFRIYGSRGTFKDYEIIVGDLEVQILDEAAELLESTDGKEFYLNYSRQALGQNKKF